MISDWYALLGMPGYGQTTASAGRAFWRASARPDRVACEVDGKLTYRFQPGPLAWQYREGSLLAANFNALWCQALNIRHKGGRCDYFAMLHADVEPPDGWLDFLIEELESNELDVLGVVVPIKDRHGTTSIALDNDTGDTWSPLCRLTMTEIFRLPATFTSEDVGHPLLLNTGCWVCKFDPKWARKVHFTVNDRIAFNLFSDEYEPQCEPEDWFFSRLCHEQKLRIGATRKVALAHMGSMRVRNTHPWGDYDFDREYVKASVLPLVDRDGFRYPFDVDGWLSFDEGKALWDLARGEQDWRRVLEIGSYCGRSTICLAQTACMVLAVDPHDGRATPAPRSTLEEMKGNLVRYGVDDRVQVLRGTVEDVSPADGPFDLVFIDGDHSVDSVRNDIQQARALLTPDGLIALHDYRAVPGQYDGREDPGVREAIHELFAAGGKLLSTHGTLAVVRPPAGLLLEV